MIIIGYLCTAINYVAYCSSRFMKKKWQMFLLDIVSKISTIIGLWCLNSLTGSYMFIITLAFLLIAFVLEKKNINLAILFPICSIAYLLIFILQYEGFSSIFVFVSSVISLFANIFLNEQNIRLVGSFNSIIYIIYLILIKNWVGLLEIFVIFSNLIAYFKYKKLQNTNNTNE